MEAPLRRYCLVISDKCIALNFKHLTANHIIEYVNFLIIF